MSVGRLMRDSRLGMATMALAVVSAMALGVGPVAAAARAGSTVASTGRAGIISTIAGGVGRPGAATSVAFGPCGVSFAGGSLYAAAGTTVRKVAPATGRLTTPAGSGTTATPGDGGPATRAGLYACGAAGDAAGNLVIADTGHNRVRVLAARAGTFYGQAMTAGDIYTIAGTGQAGFLGDGGPATSAFLHQPTRVAVDGAGNVLIADRHNQRVRVVAAAAGTFYGQAMTAGDIYTIAGTGLPGFSGDGGPATSAELFAPQDVAVDGAGNVLIADPGNMRMRVVAAATGTFYGQAMTAGDIYTVAGDGTGGFSGDGGPATSAELNFPQGVALDGAGNVLIADARNERVRVMAARTGTFYGQAMTAGDIYTIAGDGRGGFAGNGGPATSAELNFPQGVALDGTGNVLISDITNDRVRVVAARTGTFYGQAMTAGHIYAVAGNGTAGFSGDNAPATGAQLLRPFAVATDPKGNLLIADSGNDRVRVKASRTGTFYGQAMTAGDIYTIAGDGTVGFSGDGGPAIRAALGGPVGMAVDGAGNVLIADSGNERVRVAAARTGTFYGQAMTAGDIYAIAGDGRSGFAGDGGPATSAELSLQGVAVDGAGNVVIADTNNHRVRVVAAATGTFYGQAMTAGDIYTIAGTGIPGHSGDGGPAIKAELRFPQSTAVDGAGNVLIADSGNDRVRVVAARTGTFYGQAMTGGDIYTIAGTGAEGFAGDGGPATKAELAFPTALTMDGAANLLIADNLNNRIRVVAGRTGTFYGRSMTGGDIYTIAGRGRAMGGFSGDGGPAVRAEMFRPDGVAVTGAGNVAVADTGNNRIRMVTG